MSQQVLLLLSRLDVFEVSQKRMVHLATGEAPLPLAHIFVLLLSCFICCFRLFTF
jgi:hypothetical protein